jgi:predicted  nucleic acid-binding Zn-ribbon protein
MTEENEGLAAKTDALKTEKIRAQQSLDDEKARLEADRNRLTQTHNTSMEKIEQFSSTVRTLKDNNIDLSDLEQLQSMVRLTRECGGDPKKLFELSRTRSSLTRQIRREKKRIGKARKTIIKLQDRKKKLEAKIKRAQPLLAKAHALKSMGWTDETLSRAITLTKQVGKPDEVLARLELLKPSADVQAENEKTKKENDALKKENTKGLRKAVRQLARLEKGTVALLNDQLPHVLAESERLLQTHNIALMSKYEELSAKHTILLNNCNYLQKQSDMYQKRLDDAIPFSQLIWSPEKLSDNAADRLLFDLVYPKLMVRSKNKSWKERGDLLQKVVINSLGFYSDDVSSFLASPDNATSYDALKTITCMGAAFLPLYAAFKTWYALHESNGDANRLRGMWYHLEKFFTELKAM